MVIDAGVLENQTARPYRPTNDRSLPNRPFVVEKAEEGKPDGQSSYKPTTAEVLACSPLSHLLGGNHFRNVDSDERRRWY
jgi:hypothetical protein